MADPVRPMTPADLRALGAAIRDAVVPHLPRGHQQVEVLCWTRGFDTPHAVARVTIRVGDWRASAYVLVPGRDAGAAAAQCVAALRARIVARREWHETMARACESALAATNAGEVRDG